MKIACLQFAPSLGKVQENIQRAEEVLAESVDETNELDLLVLPELAFSGYNFETLAAITPFLEPTAAGPSTQWAKRVAARLNCPVSVGYPEDASSAPLHLTPEDQSTSSSLPSAPLLLSSTAKPVVPNSSPTFPRNYNSSVVVSPDGEVLAHYRKSFLYYTDATWAREGSGFWSGSLTFPDRTSRAEIQRSSDEMSADSGKEVSPATVSVKAAIGICMDLNPYNFASPWSAYEFSKHVLSSDAQLVIMNMAWLSHDLVPEMVQGAEATAPDSYTLSYWLERFQPLRENTSGLTRILVIANRCGIEGEVCYAGTSSIIGVRDGQAWIWDMCGKGEETVCIVDTEKAPKFILRTRAQSDDSDSGEEDEEDKDEGTPNVPQRAHLSRTPNEDHG